MNEAEVPVIAAGLAALGQLRMVGAAARVLRYGEHHGLIFCDDVAEPRRQTNYDLATSRGFLSIQNDSAWPGMLAKLEDFSSLLSRGEDPSWRNRSHVYYRCTECTLCTRDKSVHTYTVQPLRCTCTSTPISLKGLQDTALLLAPVRAGHHEPASTVALTPRQVSCCTMKRSGTSVEAQALAAVSGIQAFPHSSIIL